MCEFQISMCNNIGYVSDRQECIEGSAHMQTNPSTRSHPPAPSTGFCSMPSADSRKSNTHGVDLQADAPISASSKELLNFRSDRRAVRPRAREIQSISTWAR